MSPYVTHLPWVLPLVAVGAGFLVAHRFRRRVEASMAALREQAPEPGPESALPAGLADCVLRAGLPAGKRWRWIEVEQRGEMRLREGGEWVPFRARQVVRLGAPGFVWQARSRWFRVVDSYVEGRGRLEARLLGVVPVARSEGTPAIARGEALRYLAEAPWYPPVIRDCDAITWEERQEGCFVGRLRVHGTEVSLVFELDEAGDLHRVSGSRPRQVGGATVETGWVGEFSCYDEVLGIRMPRHGEVSWVTEAGEVPYWRGTVVGLRGG